MYAKNMKMEFILIFFQINAAILKYGEEIVSVVSVSFDLKSVCSLC